MNNQIIIYQTEDGQTQIDVRMENETVWLTQAQMAELFEKTPQNITMHIGNAYKEGELEKESTCKEYLQVQQEGKRSVKRYIRQREIVSEYETLTNRIRLNEQMIQNLEATAQALYRKTFVDNIDKENLPEGWRMGKIGDYAKVRSEYAFPSEWWQKEGIPVIQISNICNNTINPQMCDSISSEKY